jgi:hypothetical protein
MKIETLNELKNALNNVPNNLLEKFAIVQDEDGEICIGNILDEDEFICHKLWNKVIKKYPEIELINKYFRMVGEEAHNEESGGEPIKVIDSKIK